MNSFFKKKIPLLSTGDYVTYLNYNKVDKFQMDIFRNNITDLQVIYNDMDYGISVLKFKENKINLILSFTEDLKEHERSFGNFKKSSLFDKSFFFEDLEFKNRYTIEIDKNWDILYKTLWHILYEIYEYSEKDFYSVRFLNFSSGKANLINYTFVS
jgi:hypothetical protein